MPSRPLSTLLLTLAALGNAPYAAGQPLFDLAFPSANVAIGVRPAEMASSALVRKALDELSGAHPAAEGFLEALGPNPLLALQSILIVGEVTGGDHDRRPDDFLVLIEGDLGDGSLFEGLCKAECASERFLGYDLALTATEDGPVGFVVFDGRTAAIGPEARLRTAIQMRSAGSPRPVSSQVAALARNMSGRHFWIAATGPFEAPNEAKAGFPAAAALEGLEAFSFGLTLGADIDFGIEALLRSEKEAREISDLAHGFLTMAAASGAPGEPSPFENLRFAVDGRSLRASLRLPESEFDELVQSGLRFGPGAQPEAKAPPARARTRSGIIRIHGLENDPVVVEAGPPVP